ncbi:hypothetical protein [Salarchaeum japonicum]|uniref:hypothetical protein n=1 Tax=Salarchaeum japonicum TaxID=555573 RepID=UPI003C740C54
MSEYALRATVVDPAVLMDAAGRLADAPRPLTVDELSELIEYGSTYTSAVVTLGEELRLIIEDSEEDGYRVNRDFRMQVRQSSVEKKQILLRSRLQQYRPFISFVSSLVQDTDPARSASQVSVLFEFEVTAEHIEKQFIKLGVYSGIFDQQASDGDFEFSIDTRVITEEFIKRVADAVKSPPFARLFLQKRLDEEIIDYLDDDTVGELTTALELFWERPRSAIAAAGRAVGDVQRDLGNDYGNGYEKYSNANGITELADCLSSDELINSRHLHAGKYLGGMRNPSGGHGKDAETLKRWEVSEEVAFGYILASIHYIRSVFAFVVQDRQVL